MEVFFGSQSDKTEQKHNEEKTMCLLKRLMFLSVLRFHFFPSGTSWRCIKQVMRPNAISQLSTRRIVWQTSCRRYTSHIGLVYSQMEIHSIEIIYLPCLNSFRMSGVIFSTQCVWRWAPQIDQYHNESIRKNLQPIQYQCWTPGTFRPDKLRNKVPERVKRAVVCELVFPLAFTSIAFALVKGTI